MVRSDAEKSPRKVVGECGGKIFDCIMSDDRQRMRWSRKECDVLEFVSRLFLFCLMDAVPDLGIIIDEQIRKGAEL